MDVSYILTPEVQDQGFTLNEPDDHVLELLLHGKILARFNQTSIEVEDILKEVQEVSKN